MSIKLSRELARISIEKYRMAKDGRKWSAAARNRMSLAEFLATFGDADGSRIFVSVRTMAEKFGWSESKTYFGRPFIIRLPGREGRTVTSSASRSKYH